MLPSKSASGILPNRESFLRALREKISTISVCNVCIGSKKAFTRLFFDWESWIHAWKKFMGAGCGKKRWRAKSKKEPGTEGTSLILMVSIQMHFCRILAAACGSTPARASGTLFEAWQSEITYSIFIRSNYIPEPFYRFTFTIYFFFCDYNNPAYHNVPPYPEGHWSAISISVLSLRNFAHTVQCAYNHM